MKILVFSDSHQRNTYMQAAIEKHMSEGTVDCIFHLGDGVRDLECLSPHIPICYVDGNYEEYITGYLKRKELREYVFAEFGGYKFFLTHGHKYDVKNSHILAIAAARKKGADVLIFGHTHEQYYKYYPPTGEYEKGLYVFNPGSISRPRDNAFSYGIIEITENGISFTNALVI